MLTHVGMQKYTVGGNNYNDINEIINPGSILENIRKRKLQWKKMKSEKSRNGENEEKKWKK